MAHLNLLWLLWLFRRRRRAVQYAAEQAHGRQQVGWLRLVEEALSLLPEALYNAATRMYEDLQAMRSTGTQRNPCAWPSPTHREEFTSQIRKTSAAATTTLPLLLSFFFYCIYRRTVSLDSTQTKPQVPAEIGRPDYAVDGIPKGRGSPLPWVIEVKKEDEIAAMRESGRVAR